MSDAQIVGLTGDDQEGVVGTVLPEPLRVQVLDGDGTPIPSAPVQWSFAQGGGQVGQGQPTSSVTTMTDAAGQASIEWMLGTSAGLQQASAEIVVPSGVSAQDGPSAAPGGNGRKKEFRARGKPASASTITVAPDDPTVLTGDSLQLDAQVSDKYGNVLDTATVEWSSDDGAVAVVDDSGVVYAMSDGSATISATSGSTLDSVTVTVTTSAGNLLPTASIVTPDRNLTITLGTAVTFQGSASDADGSIASHRWDFGDGNTADVQSPGARTYSSTGTFNVSYRVTDDLGAQSLPATRSITVQDVAPPPPPPGTPPANVWFTCDWPTAGQGFAAVRDCGDMDWPRAGLNTSLAVIPDPYDFPTSNVFEVSIDDGAQYVALAPRDQMIPDTLRAVGDRIAYRFYRRIVSDGPLDDNQTHGHVLNDGFIRNSGYEGAPSITLSDPSSSVGSWFSNPGPNRPEQFAFSVSPQIVADTSYAGVQLQVDVTYRIETLIEVTQVSPVRVRWHMRVYDMAGNLLFDDDDMRFVWGLAREQTLGEYYRNGRDFMLRSDGELLGFSSMWLGLNGWSGTPGNSRYLVYGSVAICDSWCGPYPIEGVEN